MNDNINEMKDNMTTDRGLLSKLFTDDETEMVNDNSYLGQALNTEMTDNMTTDRGLVSKMEAEEHDLPVNEDIAAYRDLKVINEDGEDAHYLSTAPYTNDNIHVKQMHEMADNMTTDRGLVSKSEAEEHSHQSNEEITNDRDLNLMYEDEGKTEYNSIALKEHDNMHTNQMNEMTDNMTSDRGLETKLAAEDGEEDTGF